MGFFWVLDQDLMAGANFFFGDVETKNPGNSSSDGRAHYRNRLGVVELVEKEPLMFATVENGVPFFLPKYKKNAKILDPKQQFSTRNFHILAAEKPTF